MELKLANFRNDLISLSNNSLFTLINVDGQTNATTSISSFVVGGIDGDTVNNIQAQPRTIIFDLQINSGVDVEDAKRSILNVIKLKKPVTIYWVQNLKELKISGIVESIDMPRWNNSVLMQVTVHCEQPFWEDVADAIQQINEFINLHYFTTYENDMLYFPMDGIAFGEIDMSRTRTFTNNGDVAIGMDVEIIAYADATNPIIYDTDGNFFGIGYGTGNKKVVMHENDIIRISTHKGNKSVTLNGVSLISKVKPKSTWLQLDAGENVFSIDAEEANTKNMTFNLMYKQRFI